MDRVPSASPLRDAGSGGGGPRLDMNMGMGMKPWHVLADDLTGALDTGAAWAGQAEVPVFLGAPGASPEPLQVVATATRDAPVASLPSLLAPSLEWFTASGCAFKKVDSLLRGNTFAEIAWLLRSGRFAGAVFAPAFPAQGRFTARGHHWVAPAHQPLGACAHDRRIALAPLFDEVGLEVQPPGPVPERLPQAGPVLIPDVLGDADLDRIARLTTDPQARHWLWCASAGLAWALARQDPAAAASASAWLEPPRGTVLVLTASRHPVLREQLQQLQHLPALGAGIELRDLSGTAAMSAREAHARLTQGMQALAATRPRPAMLVVVGGDTLLALCRAAGVRCLQAGPAVRAGWGRARLVGGVWDGLTCLSRSGAFGPPDDLQSLLAAIDPQPGAPRQRKATP